MGASDRAVILLWLLVSVPTAIAIESGRKIPLYFSYITTKSGAFVAAGVIPVVDLALEQINNRSDILPNYTLNYTTIVDSKVSNNNWITVYDFRTDNRL